MPRILLVDDDPDDRDIISDALRQLHKDVVIRAADNGVRALEILETDYALGAAPCLVVLDLNMPKMNGAKTLEALKSDPRLSNITAVIYSTSVNGLEKEKCLKLGAHSYITKPVSYQESLDIAALFLDLCKRKSLG